MVTGIISTPTMVMAIPICDKLSPRPPGVTYKHASLPTDISVGPLGSPRWGCVLAQRGKSSPNPTAAKEKTQ